MAVAGNGSSAPLLLGPGELAETAGQAPDELPQEEASVYAVASSLAINAVILFSLVCTFGALLPFRRLRRVLAPRLEERRRLPSCLPCSWAVAAWRDRERLFSLQIWEKLDPDRGTDLDAAVILRFCILGFKFSFAGAIVSGALMPLYAQGTAHEAGFDRYTLSNLSILEADSHRFVPVVAAAYLLVFFFLHLAAVEWRRFILLRDMHLQRQARGFGDPSHGSAQAQRSILVELVPKAARKQDGQGVRRFFEHAFPGEGHGVHSCVLQADTRLYYKNPSALLRSTGRQSLKRLRQGLRLEDPWSETDMSPQSHVEPTLRQGVRPPPLDTPRCSERQSPLRAFSPPPASERLRVLADAADAGQHTPAPSHEAVSIANEEGEVDAEVPESAEPGTRLNNLGVILSDATELLRDTALQARSGVAEEIKALGGQAGLALDVVQDLTIGADGSDTAFVTFHSVTDRVVAEQLVLSHAGDWLARAAPEARDVYWPNVAVSHSQVRVRALFARAGLFGGLVFWSIPVASIQVWTSLDDEPPKWAQSAIGLFGYNVMRKYLPVLGLMALQYLLPEAFRLLANRFEHYKVKSQISSIVLGRNIRYQFATLWVTVISSTGLGIHEHFEYILQKPLHIFEVLRTEVPRVAMFFLTFVAARVALSLPVLLFRAVSSNLPPGKHMRPTYPDYPREATSLVLVLVLGMTYSVLAPAVLPICAVYFGFAFLTYCWLFQHVYTPEYDGGGACWEHLFNASMAGLLIGTLTLAALFYDLPDSNYFYALLVLSVLIVGTHAYYLHHFASPSRYLSLEQASKVDQRCDISVLDMLREDYYVDPILDGMGIEAPRQDGHRQQRRPGKGRGQPLEESQHSSGKCPQFKDLRDEPQELDSGHLPDDWQEPESGHSPDDRQEPESGHSPDDRQEPESGHSPDDRQEPESGHSPDDRQEPESGHSPDDRQEPDSGHSVDSRHEPDRGSAIADVRAKVHSHATVAVQTEEVGFASVGLQVDDVEWIVPGAGPDLLPERGLPGAGMTTSPIVGRDLPADVGLGLENCLQNRDGDPVATAIPARDMNGVVPIAGPEPPAVERGALSLMGAQVSGSARTRSPHLRMVDQSAASNCLSMPWRLLCLTGNMYKV